MINEDKDFKFLNAKLRIKQELTNSAASFVSAFGRIATSLDVAENWQNKENLNPEFADFSDEQKTELEKYTKELTSECISTFQEMVNALDGTNKNGEESSEEKEQPEEKKVEMVAAKVIPPSPFQPVPFGY